MRKSMRLMVGAFLHDVPRFFWCMRPSMRTGVAKPWVLLRNRNEHLIADKAQRGVVCDWQWMSELHIANVFPVAGRMLMKRALREWPILLRNEPVLSSKNPEVSFVIGHRGRSRLGHLLATLQSIAGQRGVSLECVVVEQSSVSEIQHALPPWVRYIHTPPPDPNMPYSRSWAFNVGARFARGRLLVLHDGDILVPRDYAWELLQKSREDYEIINLKRFIFYLSEAHSIKILRSETLSVESAPRSIIQNAQGGGSIAITHDSYFSIGGFDEAFEGWGGEDNEFWERAQTRRLWSYGYLPLFHLWHSAQPGKGFAEQSDAKKRYWKITRTKPEVRIQRLMTLPFGSVEGPVWDEDNVQRSF